MWMPFKFNENNNLWFFIPKRLKCKDPVALINNQFNSELFSEYMSLFHFKSTFKTTEGNRHVLSDGLILKYCTKKDKVIVDIGASDGITSMDLIKKMNNEYAKYYITDLNTSIDYSVKNGTTYFIDGNECILISNKYFITFPKQKEISKRYYKNKIPKSTEKTLILFSNGLLNFVKKANDKIEIKQHNIFETWHFEKPDIIKVANLLNKVYFSDEDLRKAFNNVFSAINEDGFLVIVDNRSIEKASIYTKRNGLPVLLEEINGGTDMSSILKTG